MKKKLFDLVKPDVFYIFIGVLIGFGLLQFLALMYQWVATISLFSGTRAGLNATKEIAVNGARVEIALAEPVASELENSAKSLHREGTPVRLVIPAVNIDLPVKFVELKNGSWEVWKKSANYAEGTSLINNQSGNTGLYGHDRPNAFAPIKQLKIGDLVEVETENNLRAVYEVEFSTTVEPGNIAVFYPTENPALTLVTCDGTLSELRYVVRAGLVSLEEKI